MNGKWTTLPTCQLIDCGPPPSIENGRISGHSSSNTFSVQCNDGYIITGERIIKCSLNGKWTALPSCEYLSCGIPEIPRNGMLLKINGTRFNAMATVKCDEGYSLAGNPVLTCQNNASWTMIPRCIQIDCGIPNITYGSIIGSTSTFYGSKIQIACNDGYALKGSDTVQCSIEGHWSTIPTCNVVTCGLPQIPANGAIASIQGTTFNKTALIKCHAGYVINGTDVVTCSSHGNWTESPTCTQDCEVPANITNGVITRQNSTDTFIVLCNHGYILIGNSTVRCDIYGKWMNASVCNPVSCGIPAIPQNRKLVTLSGTSFESTARMECDEGFLMEGSSVITCLRNGSWTWIPACEPIDCGTPKIENGIIGGYKEPTFGSIIYVTCKEGYILIGSNTVQCGRDGKWGLPICKLYPCGLPEIPENGAIDSISGTIYNRTALIACHPGFYMNGTNIVTCSNRGRWTKSPRCTPVSDCYDIIHLESNTSLSGIYNVTLWKSKAKIQVYCDMDTDGGGWTVFQYRYDGSVDFFNTNAQYENGFGNLSTEFWLGLKYIDEMSLQGKTELRIDLSAADGSTAFEIFQNFYLVAGNRHIRIDKGTGTAGDSGKGLSYNYNLPFSTRDRDLGGGNCAAKCHGAWWYKTCSYVNLNGRYLTPGTRIINGSVTSGMVYLNFKDESLKSSKMMFRRVKKTSVIRHVHCQHNLFHK
ncbi:CUB and sushi domain-containing protein 1-like [Mercenaria mercenaria]|uniref:CUB and sushi domain-containing protein 1-like n=1 Tax=Mercenaria mercenaria TaxID=6596 RepID=UPI00234F78DA|nr:CUB and sushi domain-containing protein 1-like [Mercenaria mercenaria]